MSDAEDKPPLLVHVHVPKAAGQSFMNRLWTEFGDNVVHIDYATDPWGTGAEIAPHLDRVQHQLSDPNTTALTSHCFRFEHPRRLAGRRCVYVTFLREPLAQIKSWIRYIQVHFHEFPAATRAFLRLWPDTDRVTPVEVANRLMAEHRPGRHAGGFWFLPTQFFNRDRDSVVRLLESFAFVGVTEQMEQSMQVLNRRLQPFGWALGTGLPHLNRTHDSHAPLDNHEPLSSFCATHFAGDQAVYDWAKQQLSAAVDVRDGESSATP